uniref:Uncharacterized protein n=1 Tax=Plectus sambesii TaxID=2011161 RepID=A0A914W2D0_9BILA
MASDEQRFYYLRLMAKPGDPDEPIKPKFVQWGPAREFNTSIDESPELESQAMRIVRTIGQAFEVCHKVAQQQMQERSLEENETNNNPHRTKGSIISEEDMEAIDAEEKLAVVAEASRSPSPLVAVDAPQPTIAAGRLPGRKISSDMSSLGTAVGVGSDAPGTSTTLAGNPAAVAAASASQPSLPTTAVNPMQYSSTLPFAHTWAQGFGPTMAPFGVQPQPAAFQSAQSLDQQYSYYQMPPAGGFVGPSASMPYGLGSPLMVSPYATLQLPLPRQQPAPDPMSPTSPVGGGGAGSIPTALQLSRSLEQYNQQLVRSQLDQAQQQAQVAGCQVQLLRDQLTSETTARIEAQSRTHQLLSANRELLEQVQGLVGRLQQLETRITAEIQTSAATPASPPTAVAPASNVPQTSKVAAAVPQSLHFSFHEGLSQEAKLPGPPPIDPLRPHQLQSLSDTRGGSLPPKPVERRSDSSPKKRRRPADDMGIQTEPGSTTDTTTTDYSSSDQYERASALQMPPSSSGAGPQLTPADLSVFMVNPQALQSLASLLQQQLKQQQQTPEQPQKRQPTAPVVSQNPLLQQQVQQPSPVQQQQQQRPPPPRQQFQPMPFANFSPRRGSKTLEQAEGEQAGASTTPPKKKVSSEKTDDVKDKRLLEKRDSGGSGGGAAPRPQVAFKRMSFNTALPIVKKEKEPVSAEPPDSTIAEENEDRSEEMSSYGNKYDLSFSPRRKSSADLIFRRTGSLYNATPASASAATAMYPPRKYTMPAVMIPPPPQYEARRKTLRALSVDIGQNAPLVNGPPAFSPELSPPRENHLLDEDDDDDDMAFFDPPPRKAHTQSGGGGGGGAQAIAKDIAALQTALSAGLAGTSPFAHMSRAQMAPRRQAFGLTSLSPTRHRQQLNEATAKLSDPAVLARLTRNMKHSPQSSPRFQPNGLG